MQNKIQQQRHNVCRQWWAPGAENTTAQRNNFYVTEYTYVPRLPDHAQLHSLYGKPPRWSSFCINNIHSLINTRPRPWHLIHLKVGGLGPECRSRICAHQWFLHWCTWHQVSGESGIWQRKIQKLIKQIFAADSFPWILCSASCHSSYQESCGLCEQLGSTLSVLLGGGLLVQFENFRCINQSNQSTQSSQSNWSDKSIKLDYQESRGLCKEQLGSTLSVTVGGGLYFIPFENVTNPINQSSHSNIQTRQTNPISPIYPTNQSIYQSIKLD